MLRCHFAFVSILLLGLFVTQDVRAEGANWHWIRVEPNFAEPLSWDVLRGTTTVEFGRDRFKTQLSYETGRVSYRFILEGSLSGNEIEALETQVGTDAAPRRYRGFLERTPGSRKQGALERIVLEDQRAFTYIVLMRRPLATDKDDKQ